MRKYFLFASWIFAVACVVSCKKSSDSKAKVDCIDRYSPKSSDFIVSQSGMDSISRLFTLNNLSKENLQFIQWISDSLNHPGEIDEQITSVQYFNGLPVFQSNKVDFFKNGVYQPPAQYSAYAGYTGPLPDADSSGHIPVADMRQYFQSKVSESIYTNSGDNPYTIVPDSTQYATACLQVILGYIDAAVVPGNGSNKNTALIKVWRITPTLSTNNILVIVYVTDDQSVVWGAEPLGPFNQRLFPNFY